MQPKAVKPNFALSCFWELDSKSSAAPQNHCIATPQNSHGSCPHARLPSGERQCSERLSQSWVYAFVLTNFRELSIKPSTEIYFWLIITNLHSSFMCSFFRHSLAKTRYLWSVDSLSSFWFSFFKSEWGLQSIFLGKKKKKSTVFKEDLENLPMDEYVGPMSSHYPHECSWSLVLPITFPALPWTSPELLAVSARVIASSRQMEAWSTPYERSYSSP